jgi:hypothetical protein
MGTTGSLSPYLINEEYEDNTSAYISANRLLGFEQKEVSPENEFFSFNFETDLDEDNGYQSEFNFYIGMREPNFVKPTPSTYEYSGVDNMPEKEEKTVDELFKEAYDACEATDINQLSIQDFIKYCEELYNMKTDEFLKWFEKRNYEGNVDMQLWAMYAKNQGVEE